MCGDGDMPWFGLLAVSCMSRVGVDRNADQQGER